MQGSRIQKLAFLVALALCGAGFALTGDTAQAYSTATDVCATRYSCPGGPDFCLTITFPDNSKLTCYKTAPRPADDEELPQLEEGGE